MDDKTPEVDEAERITGMDDTKETPGLDNEYPENETDSDEVEVEEKITECTPGGMDLCRQTRKE